MEKEKNNKSYYVFGIIAVLSIGVFAFFHFTDSEEPAEQEEAPTVEEDKPRESIKEEPDKENERTIAGLEEVVSGRVVYTDVERFRELMNSDYSSIIYVGTPSCPACVRYDLVVREISIELKINIYYVNIREWAQSDLNETVYGILNTGATPTTFIMYNGESIAHRVGFMDQIGLRNFLRSYNLIG